MHPGEQKYHIFFCILYGTILEVSSVRIKITRNKNKKFYLPMFRVLVTLGALSLISFTSPSSENRTPPSQPIHDLDYKADFSMSFEEKETAFEEHVQDVFNDAGLAKTGMDPKVFKKAYVGFHNLKQRGLTSSSKSILTIVDFTKSSSKKRLWTIDLSTNKIVMNSLVSHGRNTGEAKAVKFSNTPDSYMSSLGFYVTDKTYFGKHGLSLKLSGMDEGFNTNAMSRAIVVHGADYATADFIKQYGRLGRSLGCPAVPKELSKQLIETIKDETVLYIHGADASYRSSYLDEKTAIEEYASTLPNEVHATELALK
jgi:hypothetical protein